MFQLSEHGSALQFWKLQNLEEKNFRSGIIHFTIFHYLLIWMIISLIRTSSSDPGELSEEYKTTHSLIDREEFKKFNNR